MGRLLDIARLKGVTKGTNSQLPVDAPKKSIQEETKPLVAEVQGPREPTPAHCWEVPEGSSSSASLCL